MAGHDEFVCAVARAQRRGVSPASLWAISEELGWTGSALELEAELDQRVAEVRLRRQQLGRDHPSYWLPA